MIKENEFIRNIKREKQLPKEQEWQFRQYFRSLSNREKSEREYIKEKNSLSFDQWWELIGENIDDGHRVHEENKDNIRLGRKHNKLRNQLNDPSYREYIGLDPLTSEDKKKIKNNFKLNTGYDYPESVFMSQTVDITEETLEAMDQSVDNLKKGIVSEPVDLDELEDSLSEEE